MLHESFKQMLERQERYIHRTDMAAFYRIDDGVAMRINRFCLALFWAVGLTVAVLMMQGCGDPIHDIHELQRTQQGQDRELAGQARVLADTQAFLASLRLQLEMNLSYQQNIQLRLEELQIVSTGHEGQLVELEGLVTSLQNAQSILQGTLNTVIMQVAVLEGHEGIEQLIDPCDDAPGKIDEVLLRLSSGRILASVSDSQGGHNTRFSIVPAGSYTTTDGTGCRFSVNAAGVVMW